MQQLLFLVLFTATAVCSSQAAAQAQPSTSDVACPTCKPGEPAPKLAIDCPLPTRRLLRGGGGHSGGGHGGGGGHSHSGGGAGHMHSGAGSFHNGGGGGSRSVSVNNHPVVVNNHNGNQGNHGGDHHDHDHDHQNNNINNNNNWGPNYRPGGLWWFGGGPTYVSNTNVYTPGVIGCQPYQCALSEYWSSDYCRCMPDDYEDEADYADISLLGRKLLAASATAAADRTTIEADAAKMTSTGPEYLPAHPGRNSRLRAKLYKRVCKEGEPCRKATRSYKIKVHHEK